MPPLRPVSASLAQRARTAGAAPLLTYYGPEGRTELSVTSFANWVDKTTNLLEELGIEPGTAVALPVLRERPGHWMALVWPLALWASGNAVTLEPVDVDLAVVGPDADAPVAATTLACSLDAWGRPCADLPEGVLDYCAEVLAQPDASFAQPVPLDEVAWTADGVRLSHAEVAEVEPVADRVLVRPTDALATVRLLAGCIVGGGSLVVLDDAASEADRVAVSERARVVA